MTGDFTVNIHINISNPHYKRKTIKQIDNIIKAGVTALVA